MKHKLPMTSAVLAALDFPWPHSTEVVARHAEQLEQENEALRAALIQCRNASDDTEIHAMIDALIF